MTCSIAGFCNYTIDTEGRVFSLKTKRHLKYKVHRRGYYLVDLWKNNKGHTKKVHRLVAEAFIPNPQNKPAVNHKDGDKLNNNASNLEWVTNKENTKHAYATGLFNNIGENNSRHKLTTADILNIKRLRKINTQQELSEMYKVSISLISMIQTSKRRVHGI